MGRTLNTRHLPQYNSRTTEKKVNHLVFLSEAESELSDNSSQNKNLNSIQIHEGVKNDQSIDASKVLSELNANDQSLKAKQIIELPSLLEMEIFENINQENILGSNNQVLLLSVADDNVHDDEKNLKRGFSDQTVDTSKVLFESNTNDQSLKVEQINGLPPLLKIENVENINHENIQRSIVQISVLSEADECKKYHKSQLPDRSKVLSELNASDQSLKVKQINELPPLLKMETVKNINPENIQGLNNQVSFLCEADDNAHEGKKNHKCRYCDEVYFEQNNLIAHIRRKHKINEISEEEKHNKSVHEVKQTNTCEYCEQTFFNIRNLKTHIKRKHKINEISEEETSKIDNKNVYEVPKIHTCEYCEQSFFSIRNLNTHIKRNHVTILKI